MELKLNIKYEELLKLAKQLPAGKILEFKKELDEEPIEKKSDKEISDFQKLLLNGPYMSDKQYNQYKENRKSFNQWRAK